MIQDNRILYSNWAPPEPCPIPPSGKPWSGLVIRRASRSYIQKGETRDIWVFS
jgi:hypothetical protein